MSDPVDREGVTPSPGPPVGEKILSVVLEIYGPALDSPAREVLLHEVEHEILYATSVLGVALFDRFGPRVSLRVQP